MLSKLADVDPVVYFLSFSTALKYYLAYLWKDRIPKDAEEVGKVSQLVLHPIKSVQGIQLTEAECTSMAMRSGQVMDRFMVVMDSEKNGITAKHVTPLATVKSRVEGSVLHLEAPGHPPFSLNWKQSSTNGTVHRILMHCQVNQEGRDCGDQAAQWFDRVIGKPGHRLIFRDPTITYKRSVIHSTKKYAPWTKVANPEDEVAYQDVTPYMLMTDESMDDLNSKLEKPVEWSRFKPNIIVSGTKLYDEDTWKHIFIGDARFTNIKLCGRCVLTTVSPVNGEKDTVTNEPLTTLKKYRCIVPAFKDSPCMGICMVLDRPGKIKIGDQVYATRGDLTSPPA